MDKFQRKVNLLKKTSLVLISTILFILNLPEYGNSQSCCDDCIKNFTVNPWKDIVVKTGPEAITPMAATPGNPCYTVFETEQTCCPNTREILEFMLKRSQWSFEEAKNVYTLSSFYSIFLKEVNDDVKKYLEDNRIDLQARSESGTTDGSEKHTHALKDDFLNNTKYQEIIDIIGVLSNVEEQDVLKLKGNIELNNTVSKCWQKMSNYRNNAICLRCSASVNTYFNLIATTPPKKVYKVDRTMCHDLLDTCHEVWSYMANVSWAGDLLHRMKMYSGMGFDTRVSTTSLSKDTLHLLWECQNNVTICKEDQTKLDSACGLFTLSQVNQDIEGSSILFESATAVLSNIREKVTINDNIAEGGNGFYGNIIQSWDTSVTDGGGYVLPSDSIQGADLQNKYAIGFSFAIDAKEATYSDIWKVSNVFLIIILIILIKI